MNLLLLLLLPYQHVQYDRREVLLHLENRVLSLLVFLLWLFLLHLLQAAADHPELAELWLEHLFLVYYDCDLLLQEVKLNDPGHPRSREVDQGV